MIVADWPSVTPLRALGTSLGTALRQIDAGNYSQTSFSWLQFWNLDDSGHVSRWDNTLIFNVPKIGGLGRSLRLVGDVPKCEADLRQIVGRFQSAIVTADFARELPASASYQIVPDRRYAEYQYDVSEHLALRGDETHLKCSRNEARTPLREHFR